MDRSSVPSCARERAARVVPGAAVARSRRAGRRHAATRARDDRRSPAGARRHARGGDRRRLRGGDQRGGPGGPRVRRAAARRRDHRDCGSGGGHTRECAAPHRSAWMSPGRPWCRGCGRAGPSPRRSRRVRWRMAPDWCQRPAWACRCGHHRAARWCVRRGTGSAAHRAGLLTGDAITSVAGTAPVAPRQVIEAYAALRLEPTWCSGSSALEPRCSSP